MGWKKDLWEEEETTKGGRKGKGRQKKLVEKEGEEEGTKGGRRVDRLLDKTMRQGWGGFGLDIVM